MHCQISAVHVAFTLQLQARPSELRLFEATSTFIFIPAR